MKNRGGGGDLHELTGSLFKFQERCECLDGIFIAFHLPNLISYTKQGYTDNIETDLTSSPYELCYDQDIFKIRSLLSGTKIA